MIIYFQLLFLLSSLHYPGISPFFVLSFILGSCSCSCYPRSRGRGEAGGGITIDNVCFLLFLSLLLTTRYVTKSIYLCYVFELEHCRKSFGCHLHQWDTLRYRHQSPNPLGNSVLWRQLDDEDVPLARGGRPRGGGCGWGVTWAGLHHQ